MERNFQHAHASHKRALSTFLGFANFFVNSNCHLSVFFSQHTEQQNNITTTYRAMKGKMVVNEYCTFFTCKEHTPDKRLSSHPGLVGCSYIRNVCS